MRAIAIVLLGFAGSGLPGPEGVAQSRREKVELDSKLVDRVVRSQNRELFSSACEAPEGRIEDGGAKGEAAAKTLLARRGEIAAGSDVGGFLDSMVGRGEVTLAARLLIRIAEAKAVVARYEEGNVAVGRVVVSGGRFNPELVLAQMEILPGGYFAGEVADLNRPISFRCPGLAGLDVSPDGKAGDVVVVGTLTMAPIAAEPASGVRGAVSVDDRDYAASASLKLEMEGPPRNTPHNGSAPRRRWPAPIAVPVSAAGEFSAGGLTPGEYTLIVEARERETSRKKFEMAPGLTKDLGAVALRAIDVGFYLPRPAPETREIPWEEDHRSGLAKAKAEKRPLVVLLAAQGSKDCEKFEGETLDNHWIRRFLADFAFVKCLDGDERPGRPSARAATRPSSSSTATAGN